MSTRSSVRRARASARNSRRSSYSITESLEHRRLFASIVWLETFDGLPLGPMQEETAVATTDPTHVWTKTPPAGWVRDDTGVPGYNNTPDNNGVTEWIGWTFPRADWWSQAAGDQNRTSFTSDPGALARGNVMVADPDEWDDEAHPGKPNYANAEQLYDGVMTTGNISVSGVVAGTTMLEFDSSWRPEALDDGPVGERVNNQTGIIEVLYPDGTSAELIHWDSISTSPFYKDDRQSHWNEHVAVPLTLPAGVTSVKLKFTMAHSANDWWWAVDNVAVTASIDYSNVKLVGVSGGDGTGAQAANNETLWDVAYTTGATPSLTSTKIIKLPSVPDGDAIGFNPVTGLLHHVSGGTAFADDPADPRYRDNHFMETIDVVDGGNAQAGVFNANAAKYGLPAPFPSFLLPATRRTDTQIDPSFGYEARGPNEYIGAKDLVWSKAHNGFLLADQLGIFKLGADGTSTFVGDPAIGSQGPDSITYFNVGGVPTLLITQFDSLFVVNPANGQWSTSVPLAYADGTPVGSVISMVEDPNSTILLGIATDYNAPTDPLARNLVEINPVTGRVTKIGTFNVPMNDLAFTFGPPAVSATVSEVYVRGAEWVTPAGGATPFTQYLETKGLGDDVYGYRLFGNGAPTPGPAGNTENVLPWINANQLVVRYTSAPTGSGVPTTGSVTVAGLNAVASSYSVTSVAPVAGDPTAFVLTLSKPLGGGNPTTGVAPSVEENGDQIRLGIPGGGAAGSAFSLSMHVLQGDTDHLDETTTTHAVLARDFAEVKKRFFKDTTSAVTGDGADYSAFHDVDGSGSILARDFAEVKKRFFQTLPPPPAAAAGALFSAQRIAEGVLA